mgnify:CR=1 FL=1
MKPINKQSILECDELEKENHDEEMKQLDQALFALPDYPCDFKVTFLYDYHKEMNFPLVYESRLQQIFDFLESQDIKNGLDAFISDDNNLVFVLYGQGYTSRGKEGLLTTQVMVTAFDENMNPVDFSKVLHDLVVAELTVQG